MPISVAIPLFAVSLSVTLGAAALFARRLDRVGRRIGLPEAAVGLVTALAADCPEITSALVALVKGAGTVGVGLLVGASVFNVAAMVGLSALLAGGVALRRESLALEGAVGLVAVVLAAALLLGVLPASGTALLFVAVFGPYLLLLVAGPRLTARLPLPRRAVAALDRASDADEHGTVPAPESATAWRLGRLIPVEVAVIVAGSYGMVESVLAIADGWHAPRALVGLLVLGPLASLPNAFTGVRLGLARRGSALVSETLNSNTLNLFAGVVLPALFVSLARPATDVKVALVWLPATTLAAIVLLARRGGVGRAGGALLVGAYVIFAVVEVVAR